MGGEWLAGLGEGLKNAVGTYRQVRRDQDENAQREEDRKLRTQALAFDLAEKGYEVDPLHGKVVRTAGALERDEEDRALKTYQRGIELYRALGEGGQASPSGQGLLTSLNTQFRRLSVPRSQRQQVTDSPASPGARPQGLIPAGSVEGAQGLVPAGLVQDEAPNFNPPSGFKTKEERKEAARIAAEDRRAARRAQDEERKKERDNQTFRSQALVPDYELDSNFKPALPAVEKFRGLKTTVENIQRQAKELKDMIGKYGREYVPGSAKKVMQGKLRTLQLGLKEYNNLGVLNGPDMMILGEQIGDPTSLTSAYPGAIDGILANIDNIVDGTAAGLDTTASNLGYRRKATGKTLSPEDIEALNWAKQNPKDERAKAIRQRLGQ